MSPITQLRLILKLKPIAADLQKEFAMKLSTNMVIQVLGTAGQGINQLAPFVTSDKGKAYVAFGLGLIQALSALLAHFSNPDGTSAKAAYVSK